MTLTLNCSEIFCRATTGQGRPLYCGCRTLSCYAIRQSKMSSGSSSGAQLTFDASTGVMPIEPKHNLSNPKAWTPTSSPERRRANAGDADETAVAAI